MFSFWYYCSMKTKCLGSTCGIEKTAKIIAKKWTVLIIRDLLDGKKRFGELQESVSLNPRTLSQRLEELRENKIVTKKIFKEVPAHVEYELTKKGKGLAQIVKQMRKWGEEF